MEVESSFFAKASKHSKLIDVMTEKYKALIANDTWDLVPPTSGQIVGYKWVYKIECHSNGSIKSYKVRLVTQGFQ